MFRIFPTVMNNCIVLYYGFCFVTPPSQCVEISHHYRSNKKNIIASLLKFAGYIYYHKILPGNILGLILKNKMAAMGIFFYFQQGLLIAGPLEQKVL